MWSPPFYNELSAVALIREVTLQNKRSTSHLFIVISLVILAFGSSLGMQVICIGSAGNHVAVEAWHDAKQTRPARSQVSPTNSPQHELKLASQLLTDWHGLGGCLDLPLLSIMKVAWHELSKLFSFARFGKALVDVVFPSAAVKVRCTHAFNAKFSSWHKSSLPILSWHNILSKIIIIV
jgi:hypothetical protein